MASPVAIKREFVAQASSPTTPLDVDRNVKPRFEETKPDVRAKSAAQIMQDQRGNAAPSARTGLSSKRVFPIVSLNPYQGSWTIKVRVTNKSPLRTYSNARGGGNVFKVEFTDEDGTEIEATMWRESADKFYNVFELGKVYYVSKGTLKAANKQYSAVKNDYEMTLSTNTEVEEVEDKDGSLSAIPVVSYNFVKFSDLGPYVGGRRPVDIIGVVQSVTPVQTIRRKSNGEELSKREVTIADDSMKTVVVTLWDKLAMEDGEKLIDMANDTPVIAIKALKVGDYQGVSLSTTGRSTLAINPDISQAAELKTWYDSEGKVATMAPAGADMPGLRPGGRSLYEDRLALGSLDPSFGEDKTAYFNARLTVSFIKEDQPMSYQACEKCNRKVSEGQVVGFWCEGCGQNYDSSKRRYIMSLKTADSTGEAWISAFNEQAEQILGMSADQLADLKDQDERRYRAVLSKATWRSYALRVSAEVAEYKSEKRQRLKIRSISNVDWAAESAHLIQLINKM